MKMKMFKFSTAAIFIRVHAVGWTLFIYLNDVLKNSKALRVIVIPLVTGLI